MDNMQGLMLLQGSILIACVTVMYLIINRWMTNGKFIVRAAECKVPATYDKLEFMSTAYLSIANLAVVILTGETFGLFMVALWLFVTIGVYNTYRVKVDAEVEAD